MQRSCIPKMYSLQLFLFGVSLVLARETSDGTEPLALPVAKGKADAADGKKPLSNNEVFDGSTKGQLDLLLSELRQVRTEIREARQEHGRLASGVAEISGQVRVISDRKDQIKKKIRKLTKSLSKKDHHRKVKSSLRTLQQDHERILQAMAKAKVMNRGAAKRSNRTGHHNHTASHSGRDKNQEAEDGDEEAETSPSSVGKKEKGRRRKVRPNKSENETIEESESTDEIPVMMQVENKKSEQPTQIPQPTTKPTTTSTTPSTTTTTTTSTTSTTSTTTTPTTTVAPLPVNCYEVLQYGNWTSGVYSIQPGELQEPVQVSLINSITREI